MLDLYDMFRYGPVNFEPCDELKCFSSHVMVCPAWLLFQTWKLTLSCLRFIVQVTLFNFGTVMTQGGLLSFYF